MDSVFAAGECIAGDRYEMAFSANVKNSYLTIDYTSDEATIENYKDDLTKQCIVGAAHGGAENGHVIEDTHVRMNKGLIAHSLYGGGKGKGKYQVSHLLKIGATKGSENPYDYYDAEIYSLTAGRVFGNTYLTMNGGYIGRNVYGGGNIASVGKGNYSGGADDYSHYTYNDTEYSGYGETLTGNLWTSAFNPDVAESNENPKDNAWYFLSSGTTNVKVFAGTVGYVDPTNPANSIKNNLPYGNVIGGSAGEPAPNVPEGVLPRYLYCPAFYSGYVNETKVTIGGYRCNTECVINEKAYKVGDCITAEEYADLASGDQANWEKVGPVIKASIYGGGQDGHVRRDTWVIVDSCEVGLPYNNDNKSLLQTDNLDSDQWLHRGNVYAGGCGISPYTSTLEYKTGYPEKDKVPTTGPSPSAGSVSRFARVDIIGGKIHRNVYGGGSLGSVGAPNMGQGYYLYKPGQANIDGKPANSPGRQSMNTVNIAGTIGTPTEYQQHYGGEVFGACRGSSELDANQFAISIWTQVNIKNGANIQGNVFGGGDAGKVMRDTNVQVGDRAE